MKEYRSKTGGRYIFNEDILNLQELALSSVEMFKDSGLDFVISGCAITITQRTSGGVNYYDISVGAGYAFINNHIEKIAAFTGTVNSIQRIGIYETLESGPDIMYADGSTDAQYNEYKGTVKVNDSNSGNAACIVATGGGTSFKFPNLRSAYFNKYVLTNNGVIDHYDSSPVFSGSVSTSELILTGLTQDSRYPSVSIVAAELYLDENSPFVNDGIDEDTLIQGIALDGGVGGANIYSCAGQILIDRLLVNELMVSDEHISINNRSLTGHLMQFFIHKDGGILNNNANLTLTTGLSQDGDESYTEIGCGSIEVQTVDNDYRTKITGIGVETYLMKAQTIEADAIKYTDENNAISIWDIQEFFNSLDDKEINIVSPDNTSGNHGGIYIYAGSVNGQNILVKNSPDDDGDYDSVTVSATGIVVHHDEDAPVLLQYDGLWGDVHANYLYDRSANVVRSVAVSDIIGFFNNANNSNNSRSISVSEINAIFNLSLEEMREYASNGILNYALTTVVGSNVVQIGYVSMFTDDARHQLTVEITSNYVLNDNHTIGQDGHRDGKLFTYVRHYGYSTRNGLTQGQWTDWEEKYPELLGSIVTSINTQLNNGYTGSFTVDGKTLTFANGILTNVQ